MKHLFLLICVLSLLVSCNSTPKKTVQETAMQPVSLILDTDLGPDYDDVGAMAVMHALADSGYVDILATLSSNHDESVVPCIEVLNTYFNRPSIPVGAPKSEGGVTMTSGHKIKWTEALPDKYPHKTPAQNRLHHLPLLLSILFLLDMAVLFPLLFYDKLS